MSSFRPTIGDISTEKDFNKLRLGGTTVAYNRKVDKTYIFQVEAFGSSSVSAIPGSVMVREGDGYFEHFEDDMIVFFTLTNWTFDVVPGDKFPDYENVV